MIVSHTPESTESLAVLLFQEWQILITYIQTALKLLWSLAVRSFPWKVNSMHAGMKTKKPFWSSWKWYNSCWWLTLLPFINWVNIQLSLSLWVAIHSGVALELHLPRKWDNCWGPGKTISKFLWSDQFLALIPIRGTYLQLLLDIEGKAVCTVDKAWDIL